MYLKSISNKSNETNYIYILFYWKNVYHGENI